MVHYQLLSSYPVVERLAGAPSALIFFRPPLIYQKQTGANKVRVIHYQLLSSYSMPNGVPCQGNARRGVSHTPPHTSPERGRRLHPLSYIPYGNDRRAYAIRPYPAGRKKNLYPSGLLFLFSFKKTYTSHHPIPIKKINLCHSDFLFLFGFKKTYTSHQPILIKKINLCPSGLLFLFSFKKTYTSHQPIPIKKINLCPSGLPIPIHFSNLAHHTLCFSFK